MRLRRLLPWLTLTAISIGGVSGCSAVPPEPLAVIGVSGGRCAEGPCGESYAIYSNGETADSKIDLNVAPLTSAIQNSKLQELPKALEANCPSFADGQDLTIQVPAWGENVYTFCQLENGLEDPLAVEAQNLLDQLL